MDVNGNRTLEPVRKQLEGDGRKTALQSNGQRKLEQRTVRMFSATEEQEGWRTPDHSWF
jgi:hypothetical protein